MTAAYDPNFADVYDKRNAAFVNYGVALCKYTGAGGKGGASDAGAEVVGQVRKLMNDNGVFWQMAEMGKTDAGGGGTVAKFMASATSTRSTRVCPCSRCTHRMKRSPSSTADAAGAG